MSDIADRVKKIVVEHLGVESLPALDWFERHTVGRPISADAGMMKARLSLELANDLRDWHGWTWRRERLAGYLPAEVEAEALVRR